MAHCSSGPLCVKECYSFSREFQCSACFVPFPLKIWKPVHSNLTFLIFMWLCSLTKTLLLWKCEGHCLPSNGKAALCLLSFFSLPVNSDSWFLLSVLRPSVLFQYFSLPLLLFWSVIVLFCFILWHYLFSFQYVFLIYQIQ